MEQQKISHIIKSIEDEFNPEKINEVFKPVYDIINNKDKSLQRKLQLIHSVIVAMRKDFDSLAYFTDIKERNKEINRLKYHRKKQSKIYPETYEAF